MKEEGKRKGGGGEEGRVRERGIERERQREGGRGERKSEGEKGEGAERERKRERRGVGGGEEGKGHRQEGRNGEREGGGEGDVVADLLEADSQSVDGVDGGEGVDVLVQLAAAAQGQGGAGARLCVHLVSSKVTPEHSLQQNKPHNGLTCKCVCGGGELTCTCVGMGD